MRIYTYTTLIKKVVLTTFSVFVLASGNAQESSADRVHLGIIYPLSTHGTHAALDTNDFSFHLLAGISACEKGLAFSGFSNVVRHDVTGLMFSGFSNHVGRKSTGMLFAGFTNTYTEARGMQFAGFANIARGDVEGAQFAGFLNVGNTIRGSQCAGFSNHGRELTGAQFAGFLNTAKSIKGSQFAGFANITKAEVGGSQLSGFINTAGNVSGSQVAGFINIARKVKGVQIAGFINVADSSDHPIGIINIIKNGEKSIGFSIDETQTSIISFRSGGKVLYGIIGAGYNFKNEEEVYAFEAGLGAHFFRRPAFRLNSELMWQSLESFHPGEYFKVSLKALPALRIAGKMELFAGPSLNFINANTVEGKHLSDHYFWDRQNRWSDNLKGLYFGYTAGINFIFN